MIRAAGLAAFLLVLTALALRVGMVVGDPLIGVVATLMACLPLFALVLPGSPYLGRARAR